MTAIPSHVRARPGRVVPARAARVAAWVVPLLGVLGSAREAAADSMDPALSRLVASARCRTTGPDGTGAYYDPRAGYERCGLDQGAFSKLIAQYGAALAPTAMHSARTPGYGGFEIGVEANYTTIDSDASFWKDGTQGEQDPSSGRFPARNDSPDGVLQAYLVKIRKGFPFGLELTGNVGFLANTSIVTGGADVRLSVFEGFRKHVPGVLPDLAVGGSVRTITGTDQFQLSIVGVDTQISKPFPIGGTVELQPYVGYQFLRIFGDSGLVDFTPNTDAVNYCGYTGPNNPATPDPQKPFYDGQQVCTTGSSADFNNAGVFSPVRLSRHRIVGGFQFRVQMVKFGAHVAGDLVSPEDANKGADYEIPTAAEDDSPERSYNRFGDDPSNPNDQAASTQWTIALDLGAVF